MLDSDESMSMPLPAAAPAHVPAPIPARRPLKRSASTASLPTPPRTHRRHARGRSRGSCDSDSENEHAAVLTSDDENEDIEARIRHTHKSKKRRTGEAVEDDEEAFWLGGGAGESDSAGLNTHSNAHMRTASVGSLSSSKSGSNSSSRNHGVPLLYRRLLAQTEVGPGVDVAPVSPPPSHRRATAVVSPASGPDLTDSPSPPFTPRTTRAQTKRAAQAQALRDSPDNPFIVTPQKHADSATTTPNDANKTPAQLERPNLTYVLYVFLSLLSSVSSCSPSFCGIIQTNTSASTCSRGVRRVFNNPLYNHHAGRAYSPPPESKLPIDDPDYSPAMHCPPKLLFPEARRAKGKGKAKPATSARNRRRSPSLSGDEEEGEEEEIRVIRPKLLDFGPPKTQMLQKKAQKQMQTQTLEQELKSAGEPLSI
ncbi:hypothetical protein CVT25_015169 [Psilocybe cyanescens]|uniref:Uncharacterized protein n=1 Tax=Psilocybe cyanescens TaxID=93625 RepID=A0A409X205_PSICY|nr:hypothetical protein CVT25_015169 [Psilocybe cyanescens]